MSTICHIGTDCLCHTCIAKKSWCLEFYLLVHFAHLRIAHLVHSFGNGCPLFLNLSDTLNPYSPMYGGSHVVMQDYMLMCVIYPFPPTYACESNCVTIFLVHWMLSIMPNHGRMFTFIVQICQCLGFLPHFVSYIPWTLSMRNHHHESPQYICI
mgnify:FL=1